MTSVSLFQNPVNVPRISIDEVKALLAKKQIVLVDVRDKQSFADGHMPGAINVVFDDIPNYVERLAKDKRVIVTYCA
jgi:rhodanese-related sulfurtransferase